MCTGLYTEASWRFSAHWGAVGLTGLQWKCDHCRIPSLPLLPRSDLQPVQGGLPVSLPFSSTDESGRSQTNASGKWSVTGNGGREHRHWEGGVGGCRMRDVWRVKRKREREKAHLMRSVIHRHPGGHTLEWGNTTHVLTGLAHNSLGLPRLQGTPYESCPQKSSLHAAHIGVWGVLIFKATARSL